MRKFRKLMSFTAYESKIINNRGNRTNVATRTVPIRIAYEDKITFSESLVPFNFSSALSTLTCVLYNLCSVILN